jgi:hypothetical protein
MRQLKRLLRLHVDIPSVVFVLLVVILIHRPAARWVFTVVDWGERELQLPQWFGGFLLNVVSDIVAAIIVATAVVFVLGLRKKSELMGTFDAFDIAPDGTAAPWGQVKLTYKMLSDRVKGTLKHDKIEIEIEGVLERPYLRGHYVECGNAASRRLGGFLLVLNGDGNVYSGQTAYVDPRDENNVPRAGTVRWVRRIHG